VRGFLARFVETQTFSDYLQLCLLHAPGKHFTKRILRVQTNTHTDTHTHTHTHTHTRTPMYLYIQAVTH
jgi:hypothetical protein